MKEVRYESPMRKVGQVFGHNMYWADSWFTRPGLYVWIFRRNLRILPWPKRWA